jgi:hypothetical protein
MAKTIKVRLGDQEYEVPRLLIDQVEDLADIYGTTDAKGRLVDANGHELKGKAEISYSINVASIVLRNATPPIGDVRKLDCEIGELQAASNAVLEFTRLTRSAPKGNRVAGESPAP